MFTCELIEFLVSVHQMGCTIKISISYKLFATHYRVSGSWESHQLIRCPHGCVLIWKGQRDEKEEGDRREGGVRTEGRS